MRLQPFTTMLIYLLQEVFFRCVLCQLLQSDVLHLVNVANMYRSRFVLTHFGSISNMNKLEWSEELAAQARQHISCRAHRANRLSSLEDTFTHVNVGRRRNRPGVLSNILRYWYNQNRNFLPLEGACYPWNSCKKFMNMINAKHRRMGCAYIQDCGRRNDSVILMCIYEGGNQHMFDFQPGDVCTGCSGSTSFCKDRLCVSCNASRHECECTKTCQMENVGSGHLNASTCTCSCQYGLGPNCDRPCRNPLNIPDFDVCAGVTALDCQDPDIVEFCPENCICSPMPTALQDI